MKSYLGNRLVLRLTSLAWLIPLCAVLIALATGCAAIQTLIIDVDIDLRVEGRDATGRIWQASPNEIIKQTPHPKAASSFASVTYRGPIFDWGFNGADGGLSGPIYTKISTPVCVRFDQARLTSNMQSKEIPLRVTGVSYAGQIPIRDHGGEARFVAAPSLCFSEKIHAFGMVPDLSQLFPSGTMFNIRAVGKNTNLVDRGVGNWIKLHVPIEYDGKREDLEVTLVVKDSRARISYL